MASSVSRKRNQILINVKRLYFESVPLDHIDWMHAGYVVHIARTDVNPTYVNLPQDDRESTPIDDAESVPGFDQIWDNANVVIFCPGYPAPDQRVHVVGDIESELSCRCVGERCFHVVIVQVDSRTTTLYKILQLHPILWIEKIAVTCISPEQDCEHHCLLEAASSLV